MPKASLSATNTLLDFYVVNALRFAKLSRKMRESNEEFKALCASKISGDYMMKVRTLQKAIK